MNAKDERVMKMKPFLSIVIANYNYGRFLEEAIKSVLSQSCQDFELIVVDGGSEDNSVDVIKKYADKISWWCSERDRGQSDAFNKGFSHARGQFGCWLNADDLLLPGTLRAVCKKFRETPDVEWITGGVVFFKEDMKIWKMRKGTWITHGMHQWVDATVIGGPSSFFKLSRLSEVGGFNIALHYTMDCDLWHKFFAAGMRLHHLDRYFWGFRLHEASKTAHSLTGMQTQAFRAEADCQFQGRQFTKKEIHRHILALRVFKILNGSLLKSMIDTFVYRGKDIGELDFE